MKPRTRARSIALQALYEIDIAGHPPEVVLGERFADGPLEDSLADFARQIVFGVIPIVNELDDIIAKHAPEWPLDQVATIDRNILRIAIYEMAVDETVPLKVAINEAIAGNAAALESLKAEWPQLREELDAASVAESREQYLRYALSIWEECVQPDGVRDPSRAVQSLDVLCMLFNEE